MVNKKNILLLLLSVVAVVTRCVIACTTEIEVDPKCSEGKENKVGIQAEYEGEQFSVDQI